MIDYSIYLKSNPVDESAAPRAYARAQMHEIMSFSKFISHVASHGAGFSRGTIRGVISDVCTCIVEQLLEGKKVELGELGHFWITLSSEGADTMEEFTSKNIKAVNIIFTPGDDFENLIGIAEFNLVASRAVQAATIKALKANDDSVDLTSTKSSSSNSSSNNGNSNTGDTGNTSGGSGSTSGGGDMEM